ncbi:MAG: hypothetical protein OXU36_16845 [Candidatus Poribacteria bacterium]|nr:hypothetical protein [Candidatus Poribacteria bacterium]
MFIKSLTRLLVIMFFAGITIYAWAEWKSSGPKYGEKLSGLYAQARKRVNQSEKESHANISCSSRWINGNYSVEADAPGNDQSARPGTFNGKHDDEMYATPGTDGSDNYGASGSVSGTYERGDHTEEDSVSASI